MSDLFSFIYNVYWLAEDGMSRYNFYNWLINNMIKIVDNYTLTEYLGKG
jgi:hypothetical protein